MSDRLVDWSLAERVAVGLAGSGPAWDEQGERELRRVCKEASKLVRGYTGLRAWRLPKAELVDRAEWTRTNLETFREISGEIERRLARNLESGGRAGSASRGFAGVVAGIQVGLTVGYLAQRVVGQYDVALIGPVRRPRLLFVGPNLVAARERLEARPEPFLRWIAFHEVTHAVQFAGVRWLRPYIGGLARQLLEGATVRLGPAEVMARFRELDVGEIVRALAGGDLLTLLLGREQRQLADRLLAAMTVVEGYAEHVMDAVGAGLDPGFAELRERLERDRERRGLLDQLVGRLLGLDVKLAQYKRGKLFADEVVRESGIKTLNRVWSEPEALPTPEELEHPDAWLRRVGV